MPLAPQDTVSYSGRDFYIERQTGTGWFNPEDHGLGFSGYVCDGPGDEYAIERGRLHLSRSRIEILRNEQILAGLEIPFTGGMLVSHRFLFWPLYSHLGICTTMKSWAAAELIFEQGKLLEWRDLTGSILTLEAELRNDQLKGDNELGERLRIWREQKLLMEYEFRPAESPFRLPLIVRLLQPFRSRPKHTVVS